MKNFLQQIFSITNEGKNKILTICGIEFSFDNPKYYKKRSHKDKQSIEISKFFDDFQDDIQKRYSTQKFNIKNYLNGEISDLNYLGVDSFHNYLNMLINKK